MKKALCLSVIALAACARLSVESEDPIGRTAQPLISEPLRLTGADLPDKHLVLTFDDSPVSMAVTGALSTYLAARPTPIHATFFVDGSCVTTTTLPNPICATPTSDGASVLAKLKADGHLIGNHTTTARDLVNQVPIAQIVQELSETDAVISPYAAWNQKVFRAPGGSWIGDGGTDDVYNALHGTAMDAYVGPISWNIQQSDVDCWSKSLTAQQCGDLYRQEIHARGNGIVRFHDSSATVGLVEYLVPLLEADGYMFDDLVASRAVSALAAVCDSTCASCTGPAATDCASCTTGQRLAGGACTTCLLCPPGSYTTAACGSAADTQCTPCAAGTYNPTAGALSCATCEDGCDDNNDCTVDQCSPSQGCVHTHIQSCGVVDASISDNDAAPLPKLDGGPLDDEDNVAADVSDSGSGCRTAPGRSISSGGLVVALAILVSVRRRNRSASVTV